MAFHVSSTILGALWVISASLALQVGGVRVRLRGEESASEPGRTHITSQALVDAEQCFAGTKGEADHGNVGGDRMSRSRHNYAPIYQKYLSLWLTGDPAAQPPVIAEVGILTGTGLAMWSKLFPESRVFGFDRNTTSYFRNVEHLQSLGFQQGHVNVTRMDQMQPPNENRALLASAFGALRPAIVVDDGYHIPEAGQKTFLSMRPFLAERFVYFIEDVRDRDVSAGAWDAVKDKVLKDCTGCDFKVECPEKSEKGECVAVVSRALDSR